MQNREHLNIIFCGHVDSGKSTISGHLLHDVGMVDERELEALRKKASGTSGTGNCYSFIQDIGEEEMRRGKTHEVSSSYFETESKRITILDAPGHKAFVPEMIGGATQADVAVLVISARTGEFETGFDKNGQTKEHVLLVSVCGVKSMICAINKMDDVDWSKERYDEIVCKITSFLKGAGYSEKNKNLVFMPISGLNGDGLVKRVDSSKADWYQDNSLLECINKIQLPDKKTEKDILCVPLLGSYKDEGKMYIYGKVESGSFIPGDKLMILPTQKECIVESIKTDSKEMEKAYPNDNIHIKVKNIDENDIRRGYILTTKNTSLTPIYYFLAQVKILEIENILTIGSKMILHVHEALEEVTIHKILTKLNPKTKEIIEKSPTCVKSEELVTIRFELNNPTTICIQKDFDKMGRIILRFGGRTIAIGSVLKLYTTMKE